MQEASILKVPRKLQASSIGVKLQIRRVRARVSSTEAPANLRFTGPLTVQILDHQRSVNCNHCVGAGVPIDEGLYVSQGAES